GEDDVEIDGRRIGDAARLDALAQDREQLALIGDPLAAEQVPEVQAEDVVPPAAVLPELDQRPRRGDLAARPEPGGVRDAGQRPGARRDDPADWEPALRDAPQRPRLECAPGHGPGQDQRDTLRPRCLLPGRHGLGAYTPAPPRR